MTETKWTPGPWSVFIDDSGDEWSGWPISIDAVNDPDKCVVRTGGFYPYDWGTATSQREAVANARLIAKAPEMAELLRDLMEVWDPQYEPAKTLYVRTLNVLAELDK